ncbi:MAG: DUF3240 family protein [Burkholderiaceae bacterium]|nr:DUF3240 family protein [Burkholderiaceae bacterium]
MTAPAHRIPPDCLLTLAVPLALEEEILDALLRWPELAPGFSVMQGQGMGAHIELATTMEKVQGRARRVIVQIALAQAHVAPLIGALKQTLASAQIAYWVVPLMEFGRLGDPA